MEIIRVTDEFKDHWNSFVQTHAADGGLLQLWQWGEFNRTLDHKIFRLGLVDNRGQLQAAALLVRHEMPFEYNYLYCPRGPVVGSLEREELNVLFLEMRKVAAEEKSFMVRTDPAWAEGQKKYAFAKGWRKGENEVQPKCNLIIDLRKAEAELLAQMKPKTRYNIGLAERKGVKIRESKEIADMECFWQLVKQTSKRDGFASHTKEHYRKIFEIFSAEGLIRLFLAEYQGKVIAAALVSFSGTNATYLHGASADLYREVMAPYFLQWQIILSAKQAGFIFYDLGGVNGLSYFNKKWQGITRFKTGFAENLKPTEYIGSYDLVVNPVIFSVYKFIKQIRG
jgi:lipid II:glycine glycyltransferase (peptidoglycan interpeptide bridge formation enzyme)